MQRKYTLNEHVFDIINTPEKAYWLGYLYGDGSIYTYSYNFQVGLSSAELDIIEKFQKFLETDRPWYTEHRKGKFPDGRYYEGTIYTQRAHSRQMVEDLHRCGIIPRKTYDHSVPVYIPPEPLTSHFWRGLFDAEGTIAFTDFKSNGHVYKYVSLGMGLVNLEVLQQFEKFIGDGGISPHPTVTNRWSKGPTSPKVISPLLSTIYSSSTENMRLDRKYGKYLEVEQCINK